ncbi:MAG: RdgB/HAM1 family non-canonical purine NTP pyrophosphatase [Candidatus Burarchaeum sp.]|nr:RdgB/HAM1 family non-canonical purine NTP pyrophosphatase [Candidatus Burarchaeum sp.]MDO8340068.1 RdgB/HAM1 family non-canonical purine NTP pyrophosphatase [Candidatus Burarchaeum sp.]
MSLRFATSNRHKFGEAKSILNGYGIKIEHLNLAIDELRNESCARVAEASVKIAHSRARKPLFVEDSGLFVRALNGFPGTYSAWAFGKIGNEGLLRLMRGVRDRRASFVSAVAYADENGVNIFEGSCEGKISARMAGKNGFGYDPIFVPDDSHNSSQKTFAQDGALKARTSHRRRSLEKFANWHVDYQKQKKKR